MKLYEIYEESIEERLELNHENIKLFNERVEWEIKYRELEKQIKKDY
jgi:hypothetical protein